MKARCKSLVSVKENRRCSRPAVSRGFCKQHEDVRLKQERDRYMRKQITAAIEWARKEIRKCVKQGLTGTEQADHILAEVGRRWNIGAMSAVQKYFKLQTTQPDDENEYGDSDEEVEVFDEDGEITDIKE